MSYQHGGEYHNPIELAIPEISMRITDEDGNPVDGVLGALLLDESYFYDEDPWMSELLTTEESDNNGNLQMNLTGMIEPGIRVTLWLNKPQFFQKPITFTYVPSGYEGVVVG